MLFNRLLSPVLLNKSGLAQAKVNFLNKCFSNYYQVRTWPVFAETVTYIVNFNHGLLHAVLYCRIWTLATQLSMTIISSITAVSLTNSYTVVQSYIINIRIHVVMLLLLREADEDMYLQFLHTNRGFG